MLMNSSIRLMMALHALRLRKLTARGSVSISTIIWIVVAVLIAGGVLLWLTAGGGLSAIKTLLKSIVGYFGQTASTL